MLSDEKYKEKYDDLLDESTALHLVLQSVLLTLREYHIEKNKVNQKMYEHELKKLEHMKSFYLFNGEQKVEFIKMRKDDEMELFIKKSSLELIGRVSQLHQK